MRIDYMLDPVIDTGDSKLIGQIWFQPHGAYLVMRE